MKSDGNFGKLDEKFNIMHIDQRRNANSTDTTTKPSIIMSDTDNKDHQDSLEQNVEPLDEELVKLLTRTQYPFRQEKSQRLYGPPNDWTGEIPARGCEVFIGHLPRDCFEPELVPVFETIGRIYQFRLMTETESSNKGYGFCVYTNKEDAKRAVTELNNYEIRKGKCIGVCFSVDNCRLFVGGIPKDKTREEIFQQMIRITDCVKDVISYPSISDKTKNRGFAFVEYTSHKAAAMARRKLHHQPPQLWGQTIHVDWAEPEREVNEDTMSKVKILFVRNLMLTTTEEKLREIFIAHCNSNSLAVERVKKLNDFAFVHFKERDIAEKCLKELNNTQIDGSTIEISWAKPAEKSQQSSQQKAQAKMLTSSDLLASAAAVAIANGGGGTSPDLTSYFINSTTPGMLNVSGGNPGNLTNQFLGNQIGNLSSVLCQGSLANLGFANLNSNGRFQQQQNRPGKRNAAGSRSVGSQRDRKHPVEKLQKTQMNPMVNLELLDEISRRNGYGTPQYEEVPCYAYQECENKYIYGYYGSVYFPLVNLKISTPNSYCTQETARNAVAELAYLSLVYGQSFSYPMQDVLTQTAFPFGFSYMDSLTNFMNPLLSQQTPVVSPPTPSTAINQLTSKGQLISQFNPEQSIFDGQQQLQHSTNGGSVLQQTTTPNSQGSTPLPSSFYQGLTPTPTTNGSMPLDYLGFLSVPDYSQQSRPAGPMGTVDHQTFQASFSVPADLLKLTQDHHQNVIFQMPTTATSGTPTNQIQTVGEQCTPPTTLGKALAEIP